ncbi:OVARIAN TUMOR DOMAIN-containing deubiquitinating enzyme 6-like isoform X2 [Telopea speciosissima]|uniref:OVARIAN TUMOR DOMAIN-containing deubiquitinating enzyme 6-like isoform X2 n=1 Tax=Telopea speciosissima TaxID=54955 RepID=UPI001CC55EFE|nr:OVARIAN TUMOR DOMAIN-containing deubiquitinating enzyme 6-like isoform X2 [Telopea speciosissima]
MTRILIQRGSSGSSSNPCRSTLPSSSSALTQQLVTPLLPSGTKEEEQEEEVQEFVASDDLFHLCESGDDNKSARADESLPESIQGGQNGNAFDDYFDKEKTSDEDAMNFGVVMNELVGLRITENLELSENQGSSGGTSQVVSSSSHPPPPPPVPPLKPLVVHTSSRRTVLGNSNTGRTGSSRRALAWPVAARTSPSGSRPPSPRSYGEGEDYNSADEQSQYFGSSYDDAERECQFEIDIRRAKGLEVRRMVEDGNCLFRAVADQVYGDTETYHLIRQMCIDYMERERDHFSQFITEGFTSYCKRKRRDKVHGNNVEIQALSEMYNRPIHIYSYSTEPINIFHGSYNTDSPPIHLSYHLSNHYNSLVDPRRLTIGAGLGFSSLRGTNVDKDQVKAAIRAQQDQQIDNALLAEGRFYSDLELTEKEIEHMVMEASRAEYLANDKSRQQVGFRESSASSAEPSSSGTRPSSSVSQVKYRTERGLPDTILSSNMQMVLSMGFSYLQVIEAYSIFGDDVVSIVCYLLETDSSSRRKGKAAE